MMTQHSELCEAIINSAVSLASRSSWESVRLSDIAAQLNISLADIYNCFAEKEQISDAWFDRADQNMLKAMQSSVFATLDNQQKFHHLMMAWLQPLAINQKVTRQMIINKLEPGHLHIQIPALLRISRTVQWLREASDQRSALPWRAVDETVLTGVYLITFCCWLTDNTSMYQRTRGCLERQLKVASKIGFLK
ncbi:TetR/AcrR family transcriptional regulator [Methylophaga nitratireducenticrescens]|uniref:TetR/AcrR family transcriptional regulator n=1 Tax=Methylophaga nitratireducenticrescens TaxID=754476 RepID=UPI001FD1E6A6|nr:TetR/AcrR family transcriptional regulator [Methylophaga nitratireducenticrescens]